MDRAGRLAALALAVAGAGLLGLLGTVRMGGPHAGPEGVEALRSNDDAVEASHAHAHATEPSATSAGVDACVRSSPGEAITCQRCHAAIHDEWRGSGHASAFEDPVFRAEYDPSPSPFCADCHAAARARHGHRAHDGVDCASCHVAAEGTHAGPSAATETSTAATTTERGWQVCAGCHQFAFPPGELGTHGVYDPADPLQDTVHEWQASDAARDGRDCIDCHMPWVADGTTRHRSHRLVGAGDPALVRDAIVATATARARAEGLEITVTLAPGDVGHRVPTGDMFRQLRVAAWNEGTTPVEQWLGREFAQLPASDDHGFRLRPAFDDRVPAPGNGEPVQVRLLLPGVRTRQAHWSVELHRMPPAQARARGLDPSQLWTPVAEGLVRSEPG